ncbi:MAG: hypothetical protein ACOYD7_08680 [Raoultibacter sp.]|jgi:hypothetical protein
MDIVFNVMVAASAGIAAGFIFGGIKMLAKPSYSDEQVERVSVVSKKLANLVKYITFFVLAQGLLWCIYYLLLGALDATQVDYATGMSQLIVSVLTIVSIIFAFFEFLRRKA